MIRIILAVFACVVFVSTAEARQHHAPACVETNIINPVCGMSAYSVKDNNPFSGARSMHVTMHRAKREKVGKSVSYRRQDAEQPVQRVTAVAPTVVAHPAGCPSRAFCGCGAAVRIFGQPVRDLWLAANWFKFPRAAPAPGMAAVRRHHVFVLEAHLGGDVWQVYDANSGGHATRIHARSIAGYAIVNPHGAG